MGDDKKTDVDLSKWCIGVGAFVSFLLAALGNAATDVCHTIYIKKGCNISNEVYNYFETGMYVTINLLHFASFILYGWKFAKHSGKLNKDEAEDKATRTTSESVPTEPLLQKMLVFAYLCLLLMAIFGFVAPAFGMARDLQYLLEQCDSIILFTGRLKIIVVHCGFKMIVSIAATIIRISIVPMVTSEWKAIINRKWQIVVGVDDVQKVVNSKFYHLYYTYTHIGNKAKIQHKILKEWFVVQYFIYFLSVLVELVHVTRKILKEETDEDFFDIIHSVLYLCFYLSAFLLPYFVGTMLNEQHDAYYKKMLTTYLEVYITDHSGNVTEKPYEPEIIRELQKDTAEFEEKRATVFIATAGSAGIEERTGLVASAHTISAGSKVSEATLSLNKVAKATLRGISLSGESMRAELMLALLLEGQSKAKASRLTLVQQEATKATLSLNSRDSVITASLELKLKSNNQYLKVATLSCYKNDMPSSTSHLILESETAETTATLSLKEPSTNKEKKERLKVNIRPMPVPPTETRNGYGALINEEENESNVTAISSRMMKDKYMEFYNQAMMKNLAKKAEFDFIPTIFNISVPLDNQGYTFTVLLTLVSIIFNFGTIGV